MPHAVYKRWQRFLQMITDVSRYVISCNEGLRLDAPDRTVKQKIRAEPYEQDEKKQVKWNDKSDLRCYSLVFMGSAKETSSLLKILQGHSANKLCLVLKLFRTRKASVLECLSNTAFDISNVEILKIMVHKYNLAKKAIALYHSDATNSTNQRYVDMSSKDPFVMARNSVLQNIRDDYKFINNLEDIDPQKTHSNCFKVLEDIRKLDFVSNELYFDYFVKFWEKYHQSCDANIKTYKFSQLPFVERVEYLEKFANACKMKQDASDA